MVIVAKFGGTSAKDGPTLEHVIDNIILSNPKRRLIVVSAPGKRNPDDIKVTDLLIKIGNSYYESRSSSEDYEQLKGRFIGIVNHFGIEDSFLQNHFDLLESKIKVYHESKKKYLDSLMPFGEIINASIVAEVLRGNNIDAAVYRPENIGMVTDGNFGNAKLKKDSYEKIFRNLKPILDNEGKIIIVPGFYGIDENGNYTTFSRGGSDLTGAILAHALNAELYENWTDTTIRRADPRIIEDAEIIEKLTYQEARELSYSGAQILHPDTLIPLREKNIPLYVGDTFKFDNGGTYIVAKKEKNKNIVEGIAHKEGFTLITLEKVGMNEEIGYLEKLGKIFREYSISTDQVTTSIDSISIAVFGEDNDRKIDLFKDEIVQAGLADSVDIKNYDSMVCVVGEGMKHTKGVLAKLANALSSNGINIETIYQGPSERSIIFGLDQKDAIRAVRAIYDTYFRDM